MRTKILGSVSPYPTKRCNGVGYLLSDEKNALLLDCGNGSVRELNFPEDLKNLTIIISHLHKDHYADLGAIAYASYVYHNLGLLDKKIDVYIAKDEETKDYDYLMNYGKENYMNFIPYEENLKLHIGDFTVSFRETLHPIKTYAASVTNNGVKVSYSADMGYDEEMADFFDKSDLLICEASFLKGQKGRNIHLSAEEAGKLARLSNSKKLILTHFWPEISKEKYVEEARRIFEDTEPAVESTIYEL